MISKAKLKELAAYRMAKVCDQEQLFVVEGPKMCQEALAAGLPVEVVCATADWLRQNQPVCETHEVDLVALERLSSMRTPNQVWMLVSRRFKPLCDPQPSGLTLVLDRLQDPGNLGTIIRTADWFGLRHIVCSDDTVSCFNPKVVQATMGGLFRVSIEYRPLDDYLRQHAGPVYGALLDGENVYQSTLSARDALLVIGNESRGISPHLRAHITHPIQIPNIGRTCESLNASVAAAILLSEFFRQ